MQECPNKRDFTGIEIDRTKRKATHNMFCSTGLKTIVCTQVALQCDDKIPVCCSFFCRCWGQPHSVIVILVTPEDNICWLFMNAHTVFVAFQSTFTFFLLVQRCRGTRDAQCITVQEGWLKTKMCQDSLHIKLGGITLKCSWTTLRYTSGIFIYFLTIQPFQDSVQAFHCNQEKYFLEETSGFNGGD